jgi:hypothetical protein
MKPEKLLPFAVLSLFAGTLTLTQTHAVSLVYDNTTDRIPYVLRASSYEVGDQIFLGGTDRRLTEFGFEYYNTGQGDVSAQVRFYLNDGISIPGVANSATPNTVFYDSGSFQVGSTTSLATLWINDFVNGAAQPLTQDLPESFTWSVQFSGLGSSEKAGVGLYSGLEVGNNYTDYWVKKANGWQLSFSNIPGTDDDWVPVNFGAQFYATKSVPEPEMPLVFAILAAGLGSLVFYGRRYCAV